MHAPIHSYLRTHSRLLLYLLIQKCFSYCTITLFFLNYLTIFSSTHLLLCTLLINLLLHQSHSLLLTLQLLLILIILLYHPHLSFLSLLGRKVEALRRCTFRELPPTLIIHLKRFEFNIETMDRKKVREET